MSTVTMALVAFQYAQLRLLSPTFWSNLMFAIFSGIYVGTYNSMNNDISGKSLLIILGGLLAVAVGEYLANHTSFKTGKKAHIESKKVQPFSFNDRELCISKWKTFAITGLYLIIVLIRWRSFSRYASAYGAYSGVLGIVSNVRETTDEVVLSNGYINQLAMVCQIAVYIFLFVFMYNIVRLRIFRFYLLCPIIPDIINSIMTTTRSAFLAMLMAVITCYFMILVRDNKVKKVMFSRKMVIGLIIFFVFFFWYGRARNDVISIPIENYMQMYSSAAIYNLDYTIVHNWDASPLFGSYTLRRIYLRLGMISSLESAIHMPTITFSTKGFHSNIYTSLYQPLQDFGVAGMLFVRFLEAFFITNLLKKQLSRREDNPSFYIWMFFMMISVYAYAMYPVGNRFGDYLGNPSGLIRYLLYGWILVRFFISPYLGNVVIKKKV